MCEANSVEALLETVNGISEQTTAFDMWIPPQLTLHGVEITADVAMAIVLDRLLSLGFMPAGFNQDTDGRTYHYKRPSPN